MAFSPFGSRGKPVRTRLFVAAGIALFVLQIVLAQKVRREGPDKGPRAVGLIELSPNGKAHLIPVTIMIDGKFYDAAAYKASPVPMALDSGTVYEAVRSGVSQGLFTVKGARNGQNSWLGEGSWQSAAEIKAAADKRKAGQAAEKAQAAKAKEDEDNARPVLRRRGTEKSSSPAPDPGAKAPEAGSKSSPAGGGAASTSSSTAAAPATSDSSSPSIPVDDENDPQRPQLRRSRSTSAEADRSTSAAVKPLPQQAKKSTPAKEAISTPSSRPQLIPAVSDEGGPEPRPYKFDLKPEEEVTFRNKMLALATGELRSHAKLVAGETTAAAPVSPARTHVRKASKPPVLNFEDLQLRVFDLSNSNEPVLILTAQVQMPASVKDEDSTSVPVLLTLVAREDIYGDLHKVLANITDSKHLDITPRLDLIDAVDVDGDGRGELLFRKVSDIGSAFVVYRVIGNQVWPLFDGAIG